MNKRCIITLVIGLIIGLSLSGIGTYAATNYAINASKVAYSDNSNLGVTDVQAAIDGTCTKFDNQLLELKKSMYPVGSIYFSATLSTTEEVKDLLGGEWEVYGKGKTLVGVDSDDSDYEKVSTTGGSKSNNYTPSGTVGATTLSEKQIPAHKHSISHTHTTPATTIGPSGDHTHSTQATTLTNPISVSGNVLYWRSKSQGTGTGGSIRSGYISGDEYIYISIPSLYIPSSGSHYHTVPAMTTNSQNTTSSGLAGGGESHTHSFTGNSSSISTVQPYITVYMYKRIK